MATEKRLIDAKALFNDLADYWGIPKDWDGQIDKLCEDALASIENAPTVEAVEVVRCKDCKHYMLWEDSDDEKTCAKSIGLMVSAPDDFCSYGERRTNERKAD